MMAQDNSNVESNSRKQRLLKDQVRLVKRKDNARFEIVQIKDSLSFEKGFFVVIRACQMLAQKNDGIILIGLAGPSGAGKTAFTDKILSFMPSVAVISMDNYNDATRVIDGNFDDPRLTDYDTLLKNILDLKEGKTIEVPIYDFKSSCRTGYRTLEVPSSRIVIIEGIYALSEKLRPLLDLRVSVTGGVHFDLVKRVLRDIQRAGQEPEEIIYQISETVYPMYKAFIEPDLQTAHIKIVNKFNPFTGFQNPTYILKSSRNVSVEQVKSAMSEECTESLEQIYDIFLLPPGEDPETCQSYLRMRNREGKYNLMFEEWVTDPPFIISPRISFEVSVRLLGGLMALGYTIASILKRSSHVFTYESVCVKIDWLEQVNRRYVQVLGRDRLGVRSVAERLGLEGSYIPRTYLEQMKLEKLLNEVMVLPDDLKTKLSIDEEMISSPIGSVTLPTRGNKFHKSGLSHSYSSASKNLTSIKRFEDTSQEPTRALASQGAISQLSEQISTLNDRMDEFTSRIDELNSQFTKGMSYGSQSQQKIDACNGSGSASTSYFTGSAVRHSSSSTQLVKDSNLVEEITGIGRNQLKIMHQLDLLSNSLRGKMDERSREEREFKKSQRSKLDGVVVSLLLAFACGGVGIFLFKGVSPRN
ncbi:putative uridine/cytidine kinase [Helianthus annuus]|uniref:Uridine kinase n=2 Tax=Helianthus annuus TaxID=4232 RepID=A0A9K3NBB4_HELAN|nr:inorganic pyrophosphatase TTM2 [Helianthus annuus]XP_021976626.1 inorganic pyrophosphatase TTM2 [Helianthus annuus]XP_021976627.1 inorganic pyrophosphatase TTM2 [Helianthus annuus]XP_035832352.1 inorganic pyrophosphatase TTM2 [Helianthus annuus]KAF5794182.1 putative uridine kinase [Helianthus annuus]KAJ0552480.1 putative uridine/cytidine kinase [Helianthus annuus]KAJ0896609.1 putative uridine/cytidine kinase [Helianthus annuus]